MHALAILLGPYRNLSTLSASALALHPNIQVLNHAAARLLEDETIDFIADPRAAVLDRFIPAALDASTGGKRGNHGGSILLSHAFDDPDLRALYAGRYGELRLKPDSRALVWKDSMEIQLRLMADASALPAIIEYLPLVRFILPIRQPIDCALSNIRTGKISYLTSLADPTFEQALAAVLRSIAWVLERQERWPDRFLCFTQWTDARALAAQLGDFLDIPEDEQWRTDFASVFRPRATSTDHDVKQIERRLIEETLARWPKVRDALLQ